MIARLPVQLHVPALLLVSGMMQCAHAVAPAAPSGCFALAFNPTATTASIEINWTDNSTDETQWGIQVSVNNGAFADLATVGSSTTAATGTTWVTWPSAPINSTCRFKILARTATEVSAPSNTATVGTYDLNGPINFSVTAVDPFNVTMSWEEGSTSEAGFAIEQKLGAGAWTYLGSLGANIPFAGPFNLIAPLASYSFRIRAYKGTPPTTPDSAPNTNVSAYSNEAQLTAGAYPLTATAVPGQPTVNLSWPNILNEAGYQLMILLPGAADFQQLALVAANVTAYQITSPLIEAGKTYWFQVRPYNSEETIMGESAPAIVIVDGITSKSGTSGTPGGTCSHTFTQASAAAVTSRTLTGVPDPLSFNATTGVLSGNFPALGNYTLNYTVNLANGASLAQTFSIRVRPPAGPPAVGAIIPAWTGTVGATRDTPLAGTFTDPEAESAVRVSTTLGTMDFILFDTATPATVANFMNYVNAGKYTDVAFHRSVSNFVIQSGGFKGAGTGSNFTSVVTTPPVTNEPGIANVRGTVSMAKVGGDPNSATSQFFVSLGDNTANLDYQNGGFTVFGRVAGTGMTVADSINRLPRGTYELFLDGSATAVPFDDFPMNDSVLPATMDQSKLVKMTTVTPIPTLSYSVTGNTQPAVATASIVGGQLHLTGLAGGQTTVTVTATDLDNLTTIQTVLVTVNDTFATWAERNTFPGGQSGAGQDPDGDLLTNLQEYALFGVPGVANRSPAPVLGRTGAAPAQFMTLAFPVRKFTVGLSYVVEAASSPAGTWTSVWSSDQGFTHPQVISAADQADRTLVTIKDTATISAQPHRFLRLKTTQD
jgi:cyclophilin family peptidyl-prolyl cis-trans isomerase